MTTPLKILSKLFSALTVAVCVLFSTTKSLHAATLVGWAEMPLHTFTKGPTSRNFYGENGNINKQMVQGFSAVLKTDRDDSFYFLSDNGFGRKNNSADYLLRIYEVNIQFSEKNHYKNNVIPFRFVNINDSAHRLGFKIQADNEYYYQNSNNPPVDVTIRQNRLLTGADIDPESIQMDKNGNIWIGDEFGPFLLKLDASGKVLRKEIPLKEGMSPDNPYLSEDKPNLGASSGYEAMAINLAGDKLYPMLQQTLLGDPNKILRLYEFDISTEQYTGWHYKYQLDRNGSSATDIVAMNDSEFLVLETGTSRNEPYKKVFLININHVENGQIVTKKELVDLMNLQDPDDLNGDGKKAYALPYSHIEALLIIDKNTLLIANDNNHNSPTAFIKTRLDQPLELANRPLSDINKEKWQDNNFFLGQIFLGDHTYFGWVTVYAYFLTALRAGYKARQANLNKDGIYFWLSLSAFLIAIGLNRQFDLIPLLTQNLRNVASLYGWYPQREVVQLTFIFLTALILPITLTYLRLMIANAWKRYKWIWSTIALLLFFITIRAISYHYVDVLMNKTLGSLRVYQAMEMLIISLLFIATFFENKSVQSAQNLKLKI